MTIFIYKYGRQKRFIFKVGIDWGKILHEKDL